MTLVSVSVYTAAVCTTHSDSFSCTVSTSKWTSHDKHSPSLPSTAPYHNHLGVKPRNGRTRETEQELYASPHTSPQPKQVAGDHHYYSIDGARTDSGAHSDSTVLYEDLTSPSYVVCVFMWHVSSLASFPGSFRRGLGTSCVIMWCVFLLRFRDFDPDDGGVQVVSNQNVVVYNRIDVPLDDLKTQYAIPDLGVHPSSCGFELEGSDSNLFQMTSLTNGAPILSLSLVTVLFPISTTPSPKPTSTLTSTPIAVSVGSSSTSINGSGGETGCGG